MSSTVARATAPSAKATAIAVDPKALLKILHSESGANTLISLKLDGAGDTKVLVKEYQLDPVTHAVLHADFYRVAMDRMLQVTIPVIVKGEPKGVKQQGGILEFVRREIEVECLPGDIPEHVEVDVSELMLHQGVRVRDIATDPKWKPVSDPDADAGPRDHAEGRRSGGGGRRGGGADRDRPSPKSSRRARRTRTRTRRRTTRRRTTRRSSAAASAGREADRRARQSRAEVPRHAAQHRVRGRRRAGAARRRRRSSRRRSRR